MHNLTLLSLSILGSFQYSPFLHIQSSTNPNSNVFKNIHAKFFFSSFLSSKGLYSSSIVENSIFDHFIIFKPILAFAPPTSIKNQSFYGNTIPKDDNKFYKTNYTSIKNCKFMSIIDNNQEQLLPDIGLCIYSTKSLTVESCFFFAIQSYRSGSAIVFDRDEVPNVEGCLKNSIFKSITQTHIDFGSIFLSGGAVSFGRVYVESNQMTNSFIDMSIADNCLFTKVRLTGDEFNDRQLGVVTFISTKVKATNLNFTDNEMGGQSQRFGDICAILSQIDSENNFSYINIFDCEYTEYGAFSVLLNSATQQNLDLAFSNFINNSAYDDLERPMFGFELQNINATTFVIDSIVCNSEDPFLGIGRASNETESMKTMIHIIIKNSRFRSDSYKINATSDIQEIINVIPENNKLEDNTIDLPDLSSDIYSPFGYIQTSHFSPSDSFSNPFVQDSASYFDLNQDSPITAGVLATIFGIISFIVFIFLLCVRNGKNKKYKMVGDINEEDKFDKRGFDIDPNEDAGTPLENLDDNGNKKSKKKGKKNNMNETLGLSDTIQTGNEDSFEIPPS